MRYDGTDLIAEDGVSETDVWGSDFSSFSSQEGGTRKGDYAERAYGGVDCGVNMTDPGIDSTASSGRFTMADGERGDREAEGTRSGVGEPSKQTTKL